MNAVSTTGVPLLKESHSELILSRWVGKMQETVAWAYMFYDNV